MKFQNIGMNSSQFRILKFDKMTHTSGGSGISPRRGRQHTILPYFPKNCMKLKEFGPQGGLDP